jgi:spore germination protein YaaH
MPVRDHRRRARARRRSVLLLALSGAALALLLVLLFTVGPFASHLQRPGKPPLGYLRQPLGGRHYRVAAWTLGDTASLTAAAVTGSVDEVDFDWYLSQSDGSVTAVHENLPLVAKARAGDTNLFATVTNRPSANAAFSPKLARVIMATSQSRQRHIAALVRLTMDKGFDGIDLDWEELAAADRAPFSRFVEELASALHGRHRFLSVAVYPKTSEPGSWGPQKADDYARLGAAADELKIMTYAYSGGWSAPGPQAPTSWLDKVLTFAEEQVPPAKIAMGVPLFGFDWHAGRAVAINAQYAATAAARYKAPVTRDAASGEAVLRYRDAAGVKHVLYFQDERAVAAKLAFLRRRHPHLGGVAFWVMGQERPGTWQTVEKALR